MKTPPHVVICRLVTVSITVLILLAIGFGVASRGPLGALGARTSQADQLVHTLLAKGWRG
jgi:hypothetical protein